MKHVFGPVPSRRLGRSLGVDVAPYKTCSYDCVYCQLGRTPAQTISRRPYIVVDEVLDELQEGLRRNPDVVTLSGSGEPTLCANLGDLIEGIRAKTSIPVVVLTNGSLLWQPDLRKELQAAHVIIPSLDAGNATMFKAVNRPHQGIDFQEMAEGLIALRDDYAGEIWLESLLIAGYTAYEQEVDALSSWIHRIRPDRVHLNTVTRPPTETFAVAVDAERMAQLAQRIGPLATVVADYQKVHEQADFSGTEGMVLELLERRPCTLDDIGTGVGIHRNEASKYLEALLAQGRVDAKRSGHRVYYSAMSPSSTSKGTQQ